jgi:Tfp pilus assembly protein PilN
MADIIIEWDRDRLVVAQGQAQGPAAAFSLLQVLPRAADPQDTLSLVQGLQQLFPSQSERNKPKVCVVLPRQLVTIHRIQLPQVPDAEVPEMLRLQAAMKLTVPVESVLLDFAPLPIQPGAPTRDVLLVTIPGDQMALVRRTLNDAGLELAEARVGAWCFTQALARAGITTPASSAVDVVALLRRDFLELTFLRGNTVLYVHSGSSWATPEDLERTLRAELSRARLSAADILADQPIARLLLVGDPQASSAVSDQVASRLGNAAVERIDPAQSLLSLPQNSTVPAVDAATLAGALLSRSATPVEIIDFVNPRKAAEKRDLRRVKILGATLAGLVLVAGMYTWRQNRVADLQRQKSLVDAENADLREKLEAGSTDLEFAEKIGRWVDRDIEWLDELTRLRTLMPGTDRIFIDNIAMAAVPQNAVGLIRLEAWAKSEADINELTRKLREAGYGVKPFDTDLRPAAVSQEYQVRVQLEVVLPEPDENSAPAA